MKFAFDRTQIKNDASHIYVYIKVVSLRRIRNSARTLSVSCV